MNEITFIIPGTPRPDFMEWLGAFARTWYEQPIQPDPLDAELRLHVERITAHDDTIFLHLDSRGWKSEYGTLTIDIDAEVKVRKVVWHKDGGKPEDWRKVVEWMAEGADPRKIPPHCEPPPGEYHETSMALLGKAATLRLPTPLNPNNTELEIDWSWSTITGWVESFWRTLQDRSPQARIVRQEGTGNRLDLSNQYYTCFIAYGQPDLKRAGKFCKDLEARGVSCWLYDMDATVGERTWREIGQKRREAEKMVVLCSMKALIREGVLKEIEEQIDEEPDKLVPISLDDLWKEPGFKVVRGERDLKPFLLDKNYADFRNLPYDQALERLLRGLSRRDAEISRR